MAAINADAWALTGGMQHCSTFHERSTTAYLLLPHLGDRESHPWLLRIYIKGLFLDLGETLHANSVLSKYLPAIKAHHSSYKV